MQQKTWALITGASSGFGRDFAHSLAARGHDLVLVARREPLMRELADNLTAEYGIEVVVDPCDLTEPGAAAALKARLDARGIDVELLVNNAGFGLFGSFLEQPLARIEEMLRLNVIALTELTHHFGRDMAGRGAGRILLVSSISGYQATPTYAAYAASKAFVLLFGEALHEELRAKGVNVTVLSPGVSATAFLDVSGQRTTLYQRLVMMRSQAVVDIALRALDDQRASIVPGWINTLTTWSLRLFPRILQRRVAHALMRND